MESKSTLVQKAYDVVLENILSMKLKPGDVVSDLKISKDLGMSRTPVREALKRLVFETLILQAEHNKLVVAPITVEDIIDITDVRMALEMQAVELIISRHPLSGAQVTQLRALNKAMAETVESKDYSRNFQLEESFHSYLMEASGSKRLSELYRQFHLLILRARMLTLFEPHHDVTIAEHGAIIDALAANDLVGAHAALRIHLCNSRENFRRILENDRLKMAASVLSSINR